MIEAPRPWDRPRYTWPASRARTLTGTVQYSLDLLARIGEPIGRARSARPKRTGMKPITLMGIRRHLSGGPLPGLVGLSVLDLADDVAGAYCAKLLADAGATVPGERPEGHRLRPWSASGSAGRDGDTDGGLFRFPASPVQSRHRPEGPAADDAGTGSRGSTDVVIVSTFGDRSGGCPPAIDARACGGATPNWWW